MVEPAAVQRPVLGSVLGRFVVRSNGAGIELSSWPTTLYAGEPAISVEPLNSCTRPVTLTRSPTATDGAVPTYT